MDEKVKGFGCFNPDAKVLIVGSSATPRSFKAGFYYLNKKTVLPIWKMLDYVYFDGNPYFETLVKRFIFENKNAVDLIKEQLESLKIGFWDLLSETTFENGKADDGSIKRLKINESLLEMYKDRKELIILVNGSSSRYKKYAKKLIEYDPKRIKFLISLSRTATRMTFNDKCKIWKKALI